MVRAGLRSVGAFIRQGKNDSFPKCRKAFVTLLGDPVSFNCYARKRAAPPFVKAFELWLGLCRC